MPYRTACCSASWWTACRPAPSPRSILMDRDTLRSARTSTSHYRTQSLADLNGLDSRHSNDDDCLNRFQVAAKKYGVPESDIFQTIDLAEKKDIAMVTATIFALGSAVRIVFSELFPTLFVTFWMSLCRRTSIRNGADQILDQSRRKRTFATFPRSS